MNAGKDRHSSRTRGDETVFVDSATGLRDVAVDTGQPRWVRAVRYVPLVLMVCLAVLATAVGVWYQQTHKPAPLPQSGADGQSGSAASGPALPEICAQKVAEPDQGPWDASDTSRAEAAFISATTGSGAWIEGLDHYLFWSDAVNANISQAVGRVHVDATQIQAWADYITDVSRVAKDTGAQFLVMIAPAKWDVYRDKLPEWTEGLEGPTSRERLMAAHPELPWIDVRDALVARRTADPDVPLYSRVNSHWTPYGASVAWTRTVACLSAMDEGLRDLSAVDFAGVREETAPDEFSALGATDAPSVDWSVPDYAHDPGTVSVFHLQRDEKTTLRASEGLDFADLPATTTNPSASDHTLLVARDSMGNDLATGMVSTFRRTIQVRNGFDVDKPVDLEALIDLYHPDVVLLEFAERYLVQTPGSASTGAAAG